MWSSTRTTWHTMRTVCANQFLGQLKAKLLHRTKRFHRVRMEMLVQYESICNGYIEKEVKDVLIKLPAFGLTAVVTSQLVTSFHTSHVLVVQNNIVWTCYSGSCTILLTSEYSACGYWLRCSREDGKDLVFLPCTANKRALLKSLGISSVGGNNTCTLQMLQHSHIIFIHPSPPPPTHQHTQHTLGGSFE